MERSNENSISLNKYISESGICSRREADKMIEAGRISINGLISQKGNRVFKGDKVLIDGHALKSKAKTLYIAFNKPKGIVCTTDQKEKNNIIDYIGHKERLFPIGRLDKPSQGLIFLTNDGDIVNKILRAGNQHQKEYIVTVDHPINVSFASKMSSGLPILNTITKKCEVIKLSKYSFKIILTQGLNRQIRRMCGYLNYEVTRLKRTRIMNVNLGDLKEGQWRKLSPIELKDILSMVKHSSKTEDASK